MSRRVAAGVLGLIGLTNSALLFGQTRDRRLEEALTDVALLKRVVKEQDRRIAELEKIVKALQAASLEKPLEKPAVEIPPKVLGKISSPVPWQIPFAWEQIKKDMSRAQVEAILGPPTSVESVIDYQTLIYKDEANATGAITGAVKLVDDRVSQITPPQF